LEATSHYCSSTRVVTPIWSGIGRRWLSGRKTCSQG
jgi:hypothetical protein